jgi:hypothetical protein
MKLMRTLTAVVMLTGLGLLSLPAPAAATDVVVFDGDTYAAIAYSPSTGKWGYSYNYGSRWSAERAALSRCEGKDARIVAWVNNGFCALSLGDDKSAWGVGYSYGDGATNTFAKRRALAECGNRTTNARIVLCICSTDQVRPEVHK